jgi:hypothetical protein
VPLRRRYAYEQLQTSDSGGKEHYRAKVNQQGII